MKEEQRVELEAYIRYHDSIEAMRFLSQAEAALIGPEVPDQRSGCLLALLQVIESSIDLVEFQELMAIMQKMATVYLDEGHRCIPQKG